MPAYQLSRAHLVEEVEKIEAKGERVVSITPDGAQIIVITATPVRYVSGEMETR